jgi:transketolase
VRSSPQDQVALIGAGITLHEALKAADALDSRGIRARVIDLFSLKPVDVATLREAARVTGGRFVTVEDHWPEGGIGDTVLDALADSEQPPRVIKLAVRERPTSGKPEELIDAAGISAAHIAEAAERLVRQPVGTAAGSSA